MTGVWGIFPRNVEDEPLHSLVALGAVPTGEMDRKQLI